jgi:lysozyme
MTVQIADCSFWQSTLDASVMKQSLQGVILRSGQATWEDSKYKIFRDEAKSEGLLHGSYWYLDNDVSPKVQAQKWADILDGEQPPLGCWLDLEDSNLGIYAGWRNWYDALEYFKQYHNPEKLGIYTRASYFDNRVPSQQLAYFGRYKLWVAHYETLRPALPKAWDTWEFWQWTERGDGHAHGVGSHRIDLNHYNGTLADFQAEYGLSDSPTEPVTVRIVADYGGQKVEYRSK